MTTKEKILQKALELFNKEGTDSVTVRHIAKELGMSHGNLCYHYPTTDSIIEALYMQLVAELDTLIPQVGSDSVEITLQSVVGMSRHTFSLLYQYRFILLDFVRIMRRIENIKLHYRRLTQMRELQFQFIISELIKKGSFKEPLLDNQYNYWIQTAILFGDFWISSAEILYEGDENTKIDAYHKVFTNMVVPYLTEKGIEEFKALV